MVSPPPWRPGIYPEDVHADLDETADTSGLGFPPRPASAPRLDTDVEPWVGVFPGLGRIEVAADGSYTVVAEQPEPDDLETVEQREDALRFGWAEILATARRGTPRAAGMTVGFPDQSTCALITGETGEVGRLVTPLLDSGVAILADRPAPVHWQDEVLMADPCPRPVLLGVQRAASAGLPAHEARGDTDSRTVDVPRLSDSRRVAACLQLAMRRPHEQPFEVLSGHRSFEAAANIFAAGILDPGRADALAKGAVDETDAHEDAVKVGTRMAEHLRLASLPVARLLLDAEDPEASWDTALPWLREVLSA